MIAGTLIAAGQSNAGARSRASPPTRLYLDVALPAGARFAQPIAAGYSAFVYCSKAASTSARPLPRGRCRRTAPACCRTATRSRSTGGPEGGRFLLLAGRPLREPVVQYGPFVMNTREEIEQAIRDYQNGELTRAAA